MAQTLSQARREQERGLTDVAYRVLWRHVFGHTGHNVDGVIFAKEIPSQFRVVADEHARVQFALVQTFPCVLKQCFLKTLKAQALIDVS